jgi:hypothetical protein
MAKLTVRAKYSKVILPTHVHPTLTVPQQMKQPPVHVSNTRAYFNTYLPQHLCLPDLNSLNRTLRIEQETSNKTPTQDNHDCTIHFQEIGK